jgi:hypothetical protein
MQTNNQNMRRWTDSNGDYVVQGDPFNLAANGELGPSSNLNFGRPIASAAMIRHSPWGSACVRTNGSSRRVCSTN